MVASKYQALEVPTTIAKRHSTIPHKASFSLDNSQTQGMLMCGGIGSQFNREGHLKEIRGQLDKMKKYAQDKFGYRAQYINVKPKIKPVLPADRLATSIPVTKH